MTCPCKPVSAALAGVFVEKLMSTQNDIRARLEQAQIRLINAARELDAAAVHIRVTLDRLTPGDQAPYSPKPANQNEGGDEPA